MIASKTYVRADNYGALRVGATRVSLDSVVYAFQDGHSPETIREQYAALSLEEVYGAIAFYLANREEVDQYLCQQQKVWDDFRERTDQNKCVVVQRLRALREARDKTEKETRGLNAYDSGGI
jgi:uncharacterized protein (DUF433 family)